MLTWVNNAQWFDFMQLIAQVIFILLFLATSIGEITDKENKERKTSVVTAIIMGMLFYFAGTFSLFLPACG